MIVIGDAARLHQVLTNLLANARTHTGPATVVTTRLIADDHARRAERDRRWARASPSGCSRRCSSGSPAATLPAPARAAAPGWAWRSSSAVVKAHDGTIDVQSVPGRTEFTVRLPFADRA